MAVNRPTRLVELVQLLGGRRSWTPRAIAERFGISERTAFRDLADLSGSWDIPVTRDEHGYRLAAGAVLRTLSLTPLENATLKLARGHPALRSHPGATRELQLIDAKLVAASRTPEETQPTRELTGPDRSGDIPADIADTLDSAIRNRSPVRMRYRSLSSGRTTWRGIDPYLMFHRKSAWYLAGRCHVRDERRIFRLDRIAEAQPAGGAFPPPEFDLDEFLRHAWILFLGGAVQEVVVHFDASLAPLIEAGRHHPEEQVTARDDGVLEYRCSVGHLGEIARWIVGFGGLARAVEPPTLVAEVADMARRAHEAHRPASATDGI